MWHIHMVTEKKMHNLKVESRKTIFFSADLLRIQAHKEASQIALRDCRKEVRNNGDADREQMCGHSGGRRGWDKLSE